jgi:hypothetical protein
MKRAVIIPTRYCINQVAHARSEIGQTRLPDEFIISAPDATPVELPERCPVPGPTRRTSTEGAG